MPCGYRSDLGGWRISDQTTACLSEDRDTFRLEDCGLTFSWFIWRPPWRSDRLRFWFASWGGWGNRSERITDRPLVDEFDWEWAQVSSKRSWSSGRVLGKWSSLRSFRLDKLDARLVRLRGNLARNSSSKDWVSCFFLAARRLRFRWPWKGAIWLAAKSLESESWSQVGTPESSAGSKSTGSDAEGLESDAWWFLSTNSLDQRLMNR